MSINERLANQQAHIKKIYEKIEGLQAKVKRLEQEGSYFDRVENIKEVRNLNG